MVEVSLGPRAERLRSRVARGWVDDEGAARLDVLVTVGLSDWSEMLEALRDGGPRKREGGGGRWGFRDSLDVADVGDRVAILSSRSSPRPCIYKIIVVTWTDSRACHIPSSLLILARLTNR